MDFYKLFLEFYGFIVWGMYIFVNKYFKNKINENEEILINLLCI